MIKLSRKLNLKRGINSRLMILRRCIQSLLDRVSICSCCGTSRMYRLLSCSGSVTPRPAPAVDAENDSPSGSATPACHNHYKDSDLVTLKISLLGDCHIGKASFLVKYVGNSCNVQGRTHPKGLNLMNKTLLVGGARISYCIWEVAGDKRSEEHIPIACKDSVAILFMFDLTSRCTLNNVIRWYQHARRWNQTAIPVLIGTKFDDFIQLPIVLQWTIGNQAKEYAKAVNATLFFSSTTYNINVNKIFKFITAKFFDLPWTVDRNLAVGEPIIDF